MTTYMKFQDALPFGNRAQDVVADTLRSSGAMCNKVDDYARYDFEMVFNNHSFKVEVKNEDNYADSGNICVETMQGMPPRPSGVAYSEAQVFVHTLCEMCAIYRRREMHQWLKDQYANGKTMRSFGDNNNKGFILKIEDLMGYEWFDYVRTSNIASSVLWEY